MQAIDSSDIPAYQFDAPDADVLLVSADDKPIEFRVHRCILSAASPFFRDMFSLPQTSSYDKQLPVVPVSESYSILDKLLRFVYPIPDPQLCTLEALVPVLGAAIKYDFAAVITTLRRLLVTPHFLQTSPTRVFAIACRFDFDPEAKLASKHTLRINVLDCPISDDLKYITAYQYHKLLDLHRRRARAAQDMLVLPTDVRCTLCNGSGYSVFKAPKWWYEFEKRAKTKLASAPSSEGLFDVEFLAQCATAAECQRCFESLLSSYKVLEQIKSRIDGLPATI